MEPGNPNAKSLSSKHWWCLAVIASTIISCGVGVWYSLYQGDWENDFPRNEIPAYYHLVGIAITLAIFVFACIAFGIFCTVKIKGVMKIIPVLSILLNMFVLLFFMYEIYRWSS